MRSLEDDRATMGAVDGIRVLEAGLLVAAPQAAALLGDWGADVVKVELPHIGDQARWLSATPELGAGPFFVACNRGKRSVTLDLRRPSGREVFLRLAATSDVVLTNFKPGTMESWGLGYEDVAAHNPRVVYACGSAFGPLGPDAAREGTDLSAQAAGGLISRNGAGGAQSSPVGVMIADHIASLNLAAGILAALVARGRTGRGQRVDASLLGGQIWAQAGELTAYLLTGDAPRADGRGHPLIPAIYGTFPTADGWIALAGVVGPARDRLYQLLGRPELADQFPEPFYWESRKAELFPILDTLLSTRTTAEWCELFAAAGLRFAPVRGPAEIVADPGVWENGYLMEGDPDAGSAPMVASPVRFSDTPAATSATVPELGQHTEEVLLDAGYTRDDIARLRRDAAI